MQENMSSRIYHNTYNGKYETVYIETILLDQYYLH
jgi:hypothetical protein